MARIGIVALIAMPVCTFSPNSYQITSLEWVDESVLPAGVTDKRFATARFRANVNEVSGCYFDCEGRAGME